MKPHALILLTLATASILPLIANAPGEPLTRSYAAGTAPQTKKPIGLMYACSICHHQVTAAQAKKLHYICPVDHGKLLPVKPALSSIPK